MKNLLVLFLCSSMMFSCFEKSSRDSIHGLEILFLPFTLFPRTSTEEANMIDPVEFENFRIYVVQKAEKIHVVFYNKKTKKSERTYTHEKLVIDNLRQIQWMGNKLVFHYPDGTMTIHCPYGTGIWDVRGGHEKATVLTM